MSLTVASEKNEKCTRVVGYNAEAATTAFRSSDDLNMILRKETTPEV